MNILYKGVQNPAGLRSALALTMLDFGFTPIIQLHRMHAPPDRDCPPFRSHPGCRLRLRSIMLGVTLGGLLFDMIGHAATSGASALLLLVSARLAWLARQAGRREACPDPA